MISTAFSKLAARSKWIFALAALWTIALVLVARGTAKLRQHPRDAFELLANPTEEASIARLQGLEIENRRLKNELKTLPALKAEAEQWRREMEPRSNQDIALWSAHSNALRTAIELKNRELAELGRWSAEWHNAQQRQAAEARLAEKARESSAEPEKEYAALKENLGTLALARKHLIDLRTGWTRLTKEEKEKFRPRLDAAQAEWWSANEKLGKDGVLYQGFPITNSAQDPATILLMRSVVPDQNGVSVEVFLDGTVHFSKADDPKASEP